MTNKFKTLRRGQNTAFVFEASGVKALLLHAVLAGIL
jgi:hypothetical protein